MAFENDIVWQRVLDVCEPDEAARLASGSLRGIPLEQVLLANPSLNYLKSFISSLDDFNIIIQNTFRHNNSNKSPVFSTANNFAYFIETVDESLGDSGYAWNQNIWRLAQGYLRSEIEKEQEDRWHQAADIAKYTAPIESDKSLKERVESSGYYYRDYFYDMIIFLATGAYMDNDTPQESLDTWISLFDTFAKIDTWNKEFYEESSR